MTSSTPGPGWAITSRARNLHQAAGRILAEGFPRDREGWLALPGVGQYTAGAVLSIALNQPEAILDGNVERVLSRVRRVGREKGDTAFKARLWRLSRLWVERGHRQGLAPSELNQALMELGARVCTPRRPACLLCPLAPVCRAHLRGDEEAFPPRKKPKEWIERTEEVHCLFDREGRMLLARREAGQWRAGLWDFPEAVPDPAPEWVGQVESRHVVTRHKIRRVTQVWRVRPGARLLGASEPLRPGEPTRWISADAPEVAVGSALKKTLERIRETFPEVLPAPPAPGLVSARSR